jgi:Rps23 Pro-64 3,4-dihydroxylase Tpa1-like proline 4-hydroxylase
MIDLIRFSFQKHFDTLMGIASFLNTNLNFRASPHQPMNPATQESPLTIPLAVQLAEYAENDFYRAHSDNSLTKSFDQNGHRLRNNFRHYTCILYCNDAWDKEDGGALRLYPNTRKLLSVEDAIVNDYNYIDVTPQDGRLIIFDSCLIHSVEKVTHAAKKRRALTLWISRPDDSGVKGEEYY